MQFSQVGPLFVLILYVSVNFVSVMSRRGFLGQTSTYQRVEYLAQGHKAVPPVRLETATPFYILRDYKL